MHWFFDPEITPHSSSIARSEIQHFSSLRIRSGDRIVVTSGSGDALQFEVLETKTGTLAFQQSLRCAPPKPKIHLVQALAKGDRDELSVQASVELGVSSITPWQAENSVANWRGKESRGQERWKQIVISAVKQSQQAYLPEVRSIHSTAELSPIGHGILLEPGSKLSLDQIPLDFSEFTIVVGPEGGISADEIATLEAAGFVPYRLGSSVLRTSTAGPAAIAGIQALSGAWSNA